jgi:hypothetical protein
LNFNASARAFTGTPAAVNAGVSNIKVTANDGDGGSVSDEFTLTVNPAVVKVAPTLAWNTPAAIPYGTALTATQLNAVANVNGTSVAGTYTYTPALGTVLNAGTSSLKVDFTPTNTTLYNATSSTVQLTISKANQVITFPPVAGKFTTDAPFNLTASTNAAGLSVTYELVSGPATVTSAGLVTLSGTTGTVVVRALQSGNTNYNAATPVESSFAVTSPIFNAIRINAGGPTGTFGGNVFVADTYFTGAGKAYANNSIADIGNTTFDALYRTERSALADLGSFSYNIPVLSGINRYTVRLHFAEIYWGATAGGAGGTGKRVFSVSAEGTPVLLNYDMNAEVSPMNAIVKTYDVTVTDGLLNLVFSASVNQPKVSAIEVLPYQAPVNNPPVFTLGGNQTVNEDAGPQTLTGFATGIDDGDAGVTQPLTFSVTNSNNAMFSVQPAINAATGALTYTPAPNANGLATVSVKLNDGQTDSQTRTFTLTVNAVNDAPVFVKGANQTVAQNSGALTVTGWATGIGDGDPELNQPLAFEVSTNSNLLFDVLPAINAATGTLTFTPKATASGTATVTVILRDNGTAVAPNVNASVQQTFTITVNAVAQPNAAPVLAAIGNKSGTVGQVISFTASATDSNLPAQILTYTLVNAPQGATINGSTGAFGWTPQTTGTFTFAVKVTDNGTPLLSDEETIAVTVTGVAATTRRINAGGTAYTASGNRLFMADTYFTGDRTYSIASGDIANTTDDAVYRTERSAPSFAYNIPVSNGNFTVVLHFAEIYWGAPSGGPGGTGRRIFHVDMEGSRKLTNYDVYARAGGAMRAVQETFTVAVNDGLLNIAFSSGSADMPKVSAIEVIPATGVVNTAPVLAAIGNKTVTLGQTLSFTASATDAQGNALSYSLVNGPAGATIGATSGSFSWTPQTAGTFTFLVRVTDNSSPSLADEEQVSVTVQAPAGGLSFYRAINLNGDPITLDGNNWGGRTASNYTTNGTSFVNTITTLIPSTDATRTGMIRSSVWQRNLQLNLTAVPSGTYQVNLYVWEDNNPETFSITLEGRTVLTNYNSGPAGTWKKLGPYQTNITDGTISLVTTGGAANFSGIEVWRVQNTTARTAVAGAQIAEDWKVSLYPNPVREKLTVQLPFPADQVTATTVSDATGTARLTNTQVVSGSNEVEITVSELKAGLYLLRVETQHGFKVLRFLKQ